MKKYWQILKKYKSGLILTPFLVLIPVISDTIQPYLMGKIVDNGVMTSDLSYIARYGTYMIIISLVGLAVNIWNVYVSAHISIGFGTDLRTKLFNKIQTFSFPDIDKFSTSSLITRLTNDITRIQQVILMATRIMLRAPLMLIMAVFFVIKTNAQLALILAAAIPILALFIYIVLKKGFPYFVKVQDKIDSLNAVVRENLINIRVVKSFVREDYEINKFNVKSDELRDIVIRASNIIVTLFPLMQLVLNCSIIAILWFGGLRVMNGNIQVGELISFLNYIMQVLMSLMLLSMVIMTFARASASSDRVLEVLDTEPSLTDTLEGATEKNKIEHGTIEFRNVSFRYGNAEENALCDINFSIKEGETVAIAGATGSAKTTMVQLIPRLYDVTEGKILVDGRNVKDYSLDELHEKIEMVLQKNELFTGTIIDNIKWGNPDATYEEVVEAAKAAQAHDFIMSFPENYQTFLGRGGVNVSGGQKQRICIAMALLRKPKILILDDSTSAVDTETEMKVRQNLNMLLERTTVIIITQRISTMHSSDKVIILENGEINSMGTPNELMENSDMYREIYNSQQIA
ncbi:MAG: ABC transporter ATP-binding protein/permease [Rikenellaceae bacterium]|nr:ABC transporter ATP-binding protein/permease [Rikenellaceae bacterium]